jgi:hypothetical protein
MLATVRRASSISRLLWATPAHQRGDHVRPGVESLLQAPEAIDIEGCWDQPVREEEAHDGDDLRFL